MFRYNPDNKIFQALSRYGDLMALSAAWLLTSMPLLTIGASTTAMYRVLLGLASGRDETGIVRSFFTQWRREWKRGTLLWLCLLAFGALVCADFSACLLGRPAGAWGHILWTGSFAALLLELVLLIYVFAINAQFQCTVRQTFSNAVRLALGNPGRTLLLLVLLAVSAAAVIILSFFSIAVLGVFFYLSARILYQIFRPSIEQYTGPRKRDLEEQ